MRPRTRFIAMKQDGRRGSTQIVDRRDPRVLELPADLGFLDESADHLGVVAVLLPDHLDGEVPAEPGGRAPGRSLPSRPGPVRR